MRTRLSHLIVAALVVGATSCDWRKLDEAIEEAPVGAFGAPENFTGDNVGGNLLALPPVPGVAGRFLFFSTTHASGGLADLQDDGSINVFNMPGRDTGMLETRPIRSAHLIAAQNRILIGVPDHGMMSTGKNGRVFQLKINAGPQFEITPVAGPRPEPMLNDTSFGIGISSGRINGSPDLPEIVVASRENVTILTDGIDDPATRLVTHPASCVVEWNLGTEAIYDVQRAIATADVIPGIGGPDEIIVGVPRAQALMKSVGEVKILTAGDTPAIPVVCSYTISAPPPPYLGRANFGNSLAVGDFSGPMGVPDGATDLAVGAPPDKVFVYLGPFDPMAANLQPSLVIDPPPNKAVNFGARLHAMNYDGQPGMELVVTAPGVTGGSGVAKAGEIFVYQINAASGTLAGNLLTAAAPIQKFEPDENYRLGTGVTGVLFNGSCGKSANLLVGGAPGEVLVYFRGPGGFPDPRCPAM